MPTPVEHQEQYKGFQVWLCCTGRLDQWEVSAVRIVDRFTLGEPLFPKRPLPGRSDSAAHAIDRGMAWARAVIDQLDPTLDGEWSV
ncbi:hypothetical protein [Herbaspirillum rubrisubalbicans]|uniref:Uncharacterized protein n=1 Tax=Herbaspirillum rubrisubalbicans Os34 TaxID=1235827 RepID=A0A6M3ZK30_9BURK|nr:hypothetical protein [Herbaspirillum rubrisubalbicans]QJP99027.1 hypothetical protein C798_01900 [Herbaspirillum rubrisubalbicans Os34]